MSTISHLLCPIDFSDPSRRALDHALTLADRLGARLTCLHVIDPLLASAAAITRTRLDKETRDSLRDFVAAALAERPSTQVKPQIVVAAGAPEVEILKVADRTKANIIVMGTEGLSGLRKMLLGSTTDRVLRATWVPVLAVPPPERRRRRQLKDTSA
jgi:nucleotide-binding universal stress UspA family protein